MKMPKKKNSAKKSEGVRSGVGGGGWSVVGVVGDVQYKKVLFNCT